MRLDVFLTLLAKWIFGSLNKRDAWSQTPSKITKRSESQFLSIHHRSIVSMFYLPLSCYRWRTKCFARHCFHSPWSSWVQWFVTLLPTHGFLVRTACNFLSCHGEGTIFVCVCVYVCPSVYRSVCVLEVPVFVCLCVCAPGDNDSGGGVHGRCTWLVSWNRLGRALPWQDMQYSPGSSCTWGHFRCVFEQSYNTC